MQLHIHSNIESLNKAIGKEYLPAELGGENGSLADAMSRYETQLIGFSTYFKEDERYVVNEKLRAASEKDQDKSAPLVASVPNDGTFRKLNFD